MNYSRMWRKHREKLVFGTLIVGSLIFSSNDIAQNMQRASISRLQIAENNNRNQLLTEQLESEKTTATIAEARYKAGCIIVVAKNSPKTLATLVEGEPVFDRTTKKPLPVNTVVCDGNGQTGVIIKNAEGMPVVGQMAFTGNRDLAIAQTRKIRGAKVYYVVPEK